MASFVNRFLGPIIVEVRFIILAEAHGLVGATGRANGIINRTPTRPCISTTKTGVITFDRALREEYD